MSVLIAQEGALTWFENLAWECLPAPLPSGIRLLSRRGLLGIEVQGLVGAIPLQDGRTLRILPKVGNTNFFRLLFVAEGNQQELNREYEDFVSYSSDPESSVEQIAARQLLESISEILRRSPKTSRQVATVSSDFSRGQLLPVATALKIAQRTSAPVVSRTKLRSLNTPENRILNEAARRAHSMLNQAEQATYLRTLHHWIERFPRSKHISRDLEFVERSFAKNNYGGPRGYYQRALMLARVILGSHGFSISGDDNQVSGDALLINTADIFEKYLRRVVQSTHEGEGFIVTKGNANSESLYTDGSFSLEPDIIVERRNRIVLIADAKYKTPTGPDHYQMYVYLKRHSVSCGVLICPNFDSNDVMMREFLTPDRLIIRELHVPMNDLDLTEATLASIVRDYSSGY